MPCPGCQHRSSSKGRQTSDTPQAYPRVPGRHIVERYANNPVEADHGRLKARLRPMRGLKRRRSARILAPGTRSCRTSAAATTNSPPTSPPATGPTQHSTSSRWPSDSRSSPPIALCHAQRSTNATLPFNVIRIYPSRGVGIAVMGNATSYHIDAVARLAPDDNPRDQGTRPRRRPRPAHAVSPNSHAQGDRATPLAAAHAAVK
jgi:DDE domain